MQTGKMLVEIVSDKGDVSSYEPQIQVDDGNVLAFSLPVAIPLGYSFRLHAPQFDRPAEKTPAEIAAEIRAAATKGK